MMKLLGVVHLLRLSIDQQGMGLQFLNVRLSATVSCLH